jgi:hypothetical protein
MIRPPSDARQPLPPYVAALLRLYCRLPGTPSHPRRQDRDLALELHRSGLPFELVRAALLLGCARRLPPPGPGPQPVLIRSLRYFLPVIAELQQQPLDPGYVRYLEAHLRRRLRAAA